MGKKLNEAFVSLVGIQEVEVPQEMLGQIRSRIVAGKHISAYWVRTVAAGIMLLIVAEFYLMNLHISNSHSNEIEVLLPNMDSDIYYE